MLSPGREMVFYIQGDSGGRVNILGGDSIVHCVIKKVHMNMCLILNVYRGRAI
jgi:hypothetical protein